MKRKTQGRVLIQALKRKPHTYLQMLEFAISTSPWKRIKESLRDDEMLIKGINKDGLITWRVRRREKLPLLLQRW